MQTISRFMTFLPGPHGNVAGGVSEKLIAGCGVAGLVPIRSQPYMLAVEAVSKAGINGSFLLDVFPGTAYSGRTFDAVGEWKSLHAVAEREAQSYNLLEACKAGFRLESDAIGLKPFYLAEVSGGTLIASQIADMLTVYPHLAAADPIAVYELMVFRTPLAQRTLYRAVRRGLPGARYRWSADAGLKADMARRLQPPPLNPLTFPGDVAARASELVRVSLSEKIEHAQKPIALALSGGFDSRLLAAVAVELGVPLRLFSYGRRHNEETHSAIAIARALGVKLESIKYPPDNSLTNLARHLKAVEGNADLATASIANLFAADLPLGTPIVHGFLGDALAGSLCKRISGAEYRSAASLAAGIMRYYDASPANNVHSALVPAIDLDAVRSDIASTLRDDCPPYQAYLLWEFENRHRTYVGSHFALLGDHFDTIMPFYDPRLIDLWLSVPPIGMADRAVFRQFLRQYYPRLARIPHSEEPAPTIPNLSWQLSRFCRGLPKRALSAALGAESARELLLRFYRHDYIWNLGNLAAPQQRAHMLARVTELRPVLKDLLALELSDDYTSKLANNVQALRGMFLAAEYARHISCLVNP